MKDELTSRRRNKIKLMIEDPRNFSIPFGALKNFNKFKYKHFLEIQFQRKRTYLCILMRKLTCPYFHIFTNFPNLAFFFPVPYILHNRIRISVLQFIQPFKSLGNKH